MTLSIIAPDGLLSDDQHRHVERRFLFALSRYDSRISAAEVAFKPSTTPGKESWSECQVTITLRNASDVLLSEQTTDLTKDISRIAERASRSVGRSIDKALYLHRYRSVAMNAGAFS